jgi:hypothetical protein
VIPDQTKNVATADAPAKGRVFGADYGGQSSLAHFRSDVVKLDASLQRGAAEEPTKRTPVKTMTALRLRRMK